MFMTFTYFEINDMCFHYIILQYKKLLCIEKWSVDYENVFEGPINICLVERYLNGLVCHEHIIQNPINLEQSVENSFFVRTRFLQIENGDRLPEKCRIEEKSKFGFDWIQKLVFVKCSQKLHWEKVFFHPPPYFIHNQKKDKYCRNETNGFI